MRPHTEERTQSPNTQRPPRTDSTAYLFAPMAEVMVAYYHTSRMQVAVQPTRERDWARQSTLDPQAPALVFFSNRLTNDIC